MALRVVGLQLGKPGVDLPDPEPELAAHAETAWAEDVDQPTDFVLSFC